VDEVLRRDLANHSLGHHLRGMNDVPDLSQDLYRDLSGTLSRPTPVAALSVHSVQKLTLPPPCTIKTLLFRNQWGDGCYLFQSNPVGAVPRSCEFQLWRRQDLYSILFISLQQTQQDREVGRLNVHQNALKEPNRVSPESIERTAIGGCRRTQ
jgi:hypothetical protein